MKRSELIRQLMEASPPNEDPEVVVGKCDIWFTDRIPAYYDGPTQIFTERAENGYPLKGKYLRTDEMTINIWSQSFGEFLWHDDVGQPLEIDYSQLSDKDAEASRNYHKSIVEAGREIYQSLERKRFLLWLKDRYPIQDPPFIQDAIDFFNKNLSHDDPLPEDLRKRGDISFDDRRFTQWDREIAIKNGELYVRPK